MLENKNYTYEELISHMVAAAEEVDPNWTARNTLSFLKSNHVNPHKSYGIRCRSTLCLAGKGLAAARLHATDMKRAAKGWKVKQC